MNRPLECWRRGRCERDSKLGVKFGPEISRLIEGLIQVGQSPRLRHHSGRTSEMRGEAYVKESRLSLALQDLSHRLLSHLSYIIPLLSSLLNSSILHHISAAFYTHWTCLWLHPFYILLHRYSVFSLVIVTAMAPPELILGLDDFDTGERVVAQAQGNLRLTARKQNLRRNADVTAELMH